MFLKFALEGFAEGALDEGLEVLITKILIYQASTEAWGHRMRRTIKLRSRVLPSWYSRSLILKEPQNIYSQHHSYKNFPSPLQEN